MTPLQLAAERGALDVVRVLLDTGVSVHASVPGERATPLVLAATTGYGDVVRLLLEHGARLSDVDGSGRCFLEYAHVVLADAMLAAVRADATLLARVAVLDDFAVRMLCSPCAEAAELLVMALDRGAVVSDDDVSSACRSAHVDSIAVMVRRGYRPTLAALDLAARRDLALVELLVQHGAPRRRCSSTTTTATAGCAQQQAAARAAIAQMQLGQGPSCS